MILSFYCRWSGNGNELDNSGEIRYSFKGKKTARYINKQLDTPTLSFIRNELKNIYGPIESGVADSLPIEMNNQVFIVDSGIEGSKIDFGVKSVKTISDNDLRKEYIRRKYDEAIRKGHISYELSSRFGDEYVDSWNGYRRLKFGKELSTNNGQSTNNERKFSKGNGNDGRGRLTFSLKDSDGNELSPEQQEYFKDSKVRDEQGRLQVVYHATNAVFNKIDFKKNAQGVFWFASSKEDLLSGNVSTPGIRNRNSINIMELYANIKKPATWEEYDKYGIQQLKDLGYDGAILEENGEFVGFVFNSSNQVKLTTNTNPTTSPDIRFSLKSAFDKLGKYSEAETVSIEKNANFTIAKSYADIKNFIDNVKNFNNDKSLFLGKISNYYAEKIFDGTGIEVWNKSIVLNSSNLKHIFKSHGNVEKESLSGQIAISKDNIEDVIETLLSPDSVERSDSNGQIGILFKKNIGGKITAITILSEKKKALTLKSAWIIKNKQHISPTTDEKSPVSTSITGWSMNAVSNNSIRNSEENVNTNSKNFNVFNRKLKIVDFKFLLC